MQSVVEATGAPRGETGHTYAEPLSGLRVSWGAVLAGTVALISVAIVLWALALAIVMLATHPTGASIKGSVIALWICAICTTLVGAVVGGFVSGYLPGNPRRALGAIHGFVSWGLALILASAFSFLVIASGTLTAARAAVQTVGAAVETVGAAAGGGGNESLDARARKSLVSLGYTPEQADRMVAQARTTTQQTLQGNTGAGQAVSGAAKSAGSTVIDYGIGLGWTWFGTWIVSLFLAMAAGAVGASRVRRSDEGLLGGRTRPEPPSGPLPSTPLTPARSAS